MGNATFAIGLSAILVAVTYGIQSYDGRTMGWSNPAFALLIALNGVDIGMYSSPNSSSVIAGLAGALPHTLTSGLAQHGVSRQAAAQIGRLPPVSSLFAAMPGVNPVHYLLSQQGACRR